MGKATVPHVLLLVILLASTSCMLGATQPIHQSVAAQIATAIGCEVPDFMYTTSSGDEFYGNAQLEIVIEPGGSPLSFLFDSGAAFNSNPTQVNSQAEAETRAKDFLTSEGTALGVDTPPADAVVKARSEESEECSGWEVSFLTSYDGILGVPIWRVCVARSGAIPRLIVNRAHQPIDPVPTLTEQEARAALVSVSNVVDTYDQCEAYIMLLPWPENGDRLRWEITLSKSDGSAQPLSGWVDAKTGEVLPLPTGFGQAPDGSIPPPVPPPPAPNQEEAVPPGSPLLDWRATTAGGVVILLLIFLVVKLRKK